MSTTCESNYDVQSQSSYSLKSQREETKRAPTVKIVKQNKKAKFAPRVITIEDFEEKKAFIKKR